MVADPYIIVTCDNPLSAPYSICYWDPMVDGTPTLGLISEGQRFDDPREAMKQILAIQAVMKNTSWWNGGIALVVVTVEEAEMMTRIGNRMCGLLMNRGA